MSSNKNNTLEGGEFKKAITVFGGVSIVAGIMVGSGIFYLGSYVLQRTNYDTGTALMCWVIGGIISLLGALCVSELGSSRPKAGGLTVYLNEVYHPIIGYMYGFSQWLIASPGSIAAVAIAIPTALIDFFPGLTDGKVKAIAIVLVILFTLYNILGVKEAAIMANVTLVAKIIPMVVILVAAIFIGDHMPDMSPVPVDEAGNTLSFGGGIGVVCFAVLATLWAYEGWSNVANIGEEMKNPKRDLPLALIIGVAAVALLYFFFNFAIYRVIPIEEAKTMIENDQVYLGTEVAKRLFGNAGSILVVVTMLLAMLSSLNGQVLAFARIGYAMAEEGHFFKSQGKLSKRGVPAISLITQCVLSCILIMMRSLDQLTTLVVFLGMIGTVLGVAGVLVNRYRFPELEKPYKVPGGPVVVVITTLIFVALMINNFIEDPIMSILGLIIVPAIGAGIYIYYGKKEKAEKVAVNQ